MQIAKSHKHLVIITGGGTGGHVFPLLSVVRELKNIKDGLEFEYFGSGAELEKKAAKKENIKYQHIFCGKFRRYFTFGSVINNIFDFFLNLVGMIQAIYLISLKKPTAVFSKGGYASLPTVLAAALVHVPIILHESDIMPGLANRIAAHFARRLAVAFPLAAYPKEIRFRAFYSGLPLRDEFKKCFDKLPTSDNYILVVGGSSGAKDLNELVFSQIEKMLNLKPVVHVTGPADFNRANKLKEGLPVSLKEKYTVLDFSEKMYELISSSSMVISRAGATSIFEIGACRKKALLVPIRRDVTAHQYANARYLKELGLAEIYEHSQPVNLFTEKVEKILHDKESRNLGEIYFPDSSNVLARSICDEIDRHEFKKVKNIFLIGISGVSMKGIASVLKSMGKRVKGSDLKIGGHRKENISEDVDLVVYSAAADDNSPAKAEHSEARRLGIELIKRSQMIALLMKGHTGISISGMHGKTTISTLVARIFDETVNGPSYLIGADSTNYNKTAQLGRGEHFIAEACEYDDAFLNLPTDVGLISNIEEEHLDFFKGGLPEIKKHFSSFIRGIHPGGCLIFCADDLNSYDVVRENFDLLRSRKIEILSYGFKPSADFSIDRYSAKEERVTFDIVRNEKRTTVETSVFGKHFALNSAGAFAVASHFGISDISVRDVIGEYVGASRRFSLVGKRNGVVVHDDYAHHPTEIAATLSALNDMKVAGKRIVIFQPHQQKRLNVFFSKFVAALSKSREDVLFILPVFKVPGRDEDEKEVHTSQELVDEVLKKSSKKVRFIRNYDDALSELVNEVEKGDIILTMGATEVYKIGEKFLGAK